MAARNNIKAQISPAALFAKHADTIKLLATSVHGMKQASDTIESAKAIQAKCIESIKAAVKALRADKITMGDARTCAFTKAMADTFVGFGLTKGTVSNYLVDVKRAVNEGKDFVLNSARKAAEAKKAADAKAALAAQVATQTSQAVADAMAGPADLIPPAAECREGQKVKLHSDESLEHARSEDGNNGPDVQKLPVPEVYQRVVSRSKSVRDVLGAVCTDLRDINMLLNKRKVETILEILVDIENEVLEASVR